MDRPLKTAFSGVDATEDPATFVQYLDATRATSFYQEIKRRSIALLDPRPGDRLLDAGCGTGDDVLSLAAAGHPATVIGIDCSRAMLVEARVRARGARHPIAFVAGDVEALPFASGSFDGIRVERLLQHVPDTIAAFGELVRVLAPGGALVCWESDLELLLFAAPDRAVSRQIESVICDGFQHGAIGYQLPRLYRRFGLRDVEFEILTRALTDYALVESAFDLRASASRAVEIGVCTPSEAADWLASQEAAARNGDFLCAVGGFLVTGRK